MGICTGAIGARKPDRKNQDSDKLWSGKKRGTGERLPESRRLPTVTLVLSMTLRRYNDEIKQQTSGFRISAG